MPHFSIEEKSYFCFFMNASRTSISRYVLPITAIVLILISIYSFRKIKDLISFSTSIEHTQELQNYLERMVSIVKDAETNQRGFLLTNDTIYRNAYYTADTTISSYYIKIKQLTQDDLFQTQSLDTLITVISERFTFLNYVLTRKDELMATERNAERIKIMAAGKRSMDEVRKISNGILIREEAILEKHRSANNSLKSITPVLLLSLSLVSLFLIIYSYLSISHELKQKVIFQNELEIKIGELNRSNSELEQFAYVASHDLQEPLRKIRSFGDRLLMRHASQLDDDAKQSIEKMQNASSRMQKLIDDLLSFSRFSTVTEQFEHVQLSTILTEVLNDLEVTIRQKNAIITVNELPEIEAIPSQVHQVFQNLISNALKFSHEGITPVISIRSSLVKGTELTIEPASPSAESFYKIDVSDNGIGFDEKYLDRIFIIFQRLHGRMEYGGTGIGLAVSKKIMNIHHGFITASSKPGEGSIFTLYFPVKKYIT